MGACAPLREKLCGTRRSRWLDLKTHHRGHGGHRETATEFTQRPKLHKFKAELGRITQVAMNEDDFWKP